MFNRFRIVLLFAGLVILSASSVRGSGFIKLREIFAKSETVAIVKLVKLPPYEVPRKAKLNVLGVLKGHLGTGEQEVSYAEYEHPELETGEFVAFLDKERQWRYSAAPVRGTTVNSGLLLVSAFNVWKTPLVSPGYLSLAQLKDYLRTGKLLYSFSGPVWFPQRGKILWAPGGMRIEGTYDAARDSAQVTGLGQLAGFAIEPRVDLTRPPRKPQIRLSYSDRRDRPLEIHGQFERLDQRTGDLIARFAVMEPDVLSEATLKKYLTNPKLGASCYKFRLRCLATRDYPKLDLTLTLNGDNDHRLEGWGSGPLQIDCANLTVVYQGLQRSIGMLTAVPPAQATSPPAEPPSDGTLRVVTFPQKDQTIVLDFNIAKPTNDKGDLDWEFLGVSHLQSTLLYRVNSGPVQGTLSLYDGRALRAITSFSVDVDPVAFGPVSGK